ncbi:MAG: two-component regulator propeller domain-containing protein [Bacteroidota bacterium]
MKRTFIIGIGLLVHTMLYGQQHKFTKVKANSTLVSSEIIDMMQDQDGFIWIASTEGLGRYDGHDVVEWRHFKNIENSICNNRVQSIHQANDGKIWIGTKGGLSVYDPVSEQTRCLYNEGKNISRGDNIVISVIADRFGYVWYSTYNGLYRMDPITEERQVFLPDEHDPHSISSLLTYSIFEDSKGVLWFANTKGLSYYKNDGSFQFTNYVNDEKGVSGSNLDALFKFCETENGELWVGGRSGFFQILRNGQSLLFKKFIHDAENPNTLSYNFVNHLMANGNDLWVSTWAGGVNHVVFDDNGEAIFTHYRNEKNDPYSLQTDEVNTTFFDASGVLWVGTSFGLMKSSPTSSKFGLISERPNVAQTMTNNKVQATLVDSKGNLWVGTDDGLNFRPARYGIDENHFINIKHVEGRSNSLTHNNIFDIYEDSSHRVWISTYDGFSIADLNTFDRVREFKNIRFRKFPHKWVYDIMETEKNQFWVSTYGKMAKMYFSPGAEHPELTIFDMDPDNPKALSNATTYQTCKDHKGRVWVGTYFGLSMIVEGKDSTTFVNFYKERNEAGSISDVTINCLFLDSGGRFWIGTRNGLNLLLEDDSGNMSFKTFDESNGLPNPVIKFMEEDFQGRLWIGTGDGVVHFDPIKATKGESAVLQIYTEFDGLGKNNTTVRSSCQDWRGNIYFGSDGLNYFNPNDILLNDNVPNLLFTKLKVGNKDIKPQPEGILHSSISKIGTDINLQHDDNTIEIFFTSLDFSNPVKNRFKYRMEGINEDWVDNGNKNSAVFTNLDAGKYIFHVVGSNNDGVWNTSPISMTLNVAPHWAQSRLAYVLYALSFITLLGFLYRWRTERAKEKMKIIKDIEYARLEERENLRKKNAADFHDELGHRLTKISLFLEIARKQVNGNQKLVEYLEKVKLNTKSLSEGLKDLIWSLDPKKDTLLDTVNRIQEVGDEIFDYSDMEFSTNAVQPDYEAIKLSPSERKHILLIFKEAMNNTLKYSNAKRCKFQSEMKEGSIYFTFMDDGVGFDPHSISPGNGLHNMEERAQKIGGTLDLETAADEGTKMTISIRLTDKTLLTKPKYQAHGY